MNDQEKEIQKTEEEKDIFNEALKEENIKKEKKTFKSILLKDNVIHNFLIVVYYFLVMDVITPLLALLFRAGGTVSSGAEVLFEWLIYLLLLLGMVFILPDIISDAKKFNNMSVKKMLFYMFIGVALTYGVMLISNIILNLISSSSSSENENAIESMLFSNYGLLLIPVVCFIGPVVEELVFRVGLQKGLIKLHVLPVFAILISGIVFGFMHVLSAGDYIQVIPYLGMGFVFGIWYYKCDNIYPIMFVHIFNNCMSVGATYIMGLLGR